MRTWQIERRKRTRHLIELGGLVIKAGIVDLIGAEVAEGVCTVLPLARKRQNSAPPTPSPQKDV
jgi:hypothetical protein